MKGAAGVMGFFHGVAMAAMVLGVMLGAIWLALWGLAAVGGPDWRMPMQILQSAGTLILIGWIVRLLLRAAPAKEAT